MQTNILKISIPDSLEKEVEKGYSEGVSGAFMGFINGKAIQAGGCNFPENPMEASPIKKFYSGIYEIEEKSAASWTPKRVASLPKALAYGQMVSTPKGLVFVGGSNSEGSFPEVYILKCTEDNYEIENLNNLPGTIDNFAITSIGNTVYVAGGNFNGEPSSKIFKLEIGEKDGWKELQPFPGNPRVQPVMAHGKDKDGKEYIYLWGGFAGKGENREASLNTDGLKLDLENGEWYHLDAPKDAEGKEISTGGGCCAILGDGRIAVAGGVNKDIFLSALKSLPEGYILHEPEWYKFNPNLLIFNPVKEEWCIELTSVALARAGAGMVSDNMTLIISGGEIKPRIRTADVFVVTI